jgi:hypothetical protein
MQFIKITTLFFVVGLVFASCIKDKGNNFALQSSPSPNTADFPNQSEIFGLDLTPAPVIITFYVEANSSNNSNPSVDVTIVKNMTVASAAGYEWLPDSSYQLLNTTATVDPVTKLAAFKIKAFPPKIALGHNWGLGFVISAVSNGVVIATNKNYEAIGIGVKNRYDGPYHSNGYFYHPASPRAITNRAKYLATASANSVTTTLGDLGFGIVITVDGTNHVTIEDVASGPGIGPTTQLASLAAGSPPAYAPFAGSNPALYNNTYNPVTQTFYLRYGYLGGTGWRDIEEILTHD